MRHVFILALLGAAAYGATPMNGLKLGTDANGNGQSITNLNGITATGTVCSATITGAVHASTLTIAGKALGTAAALDAGSDFNEVPVWQQDDTGTYTNDETMFVIQHYDSQQVLERNTAAELITAGVLGELATNNLSAVTSIVSGVAGDQIAQHTATTNTSAHNYTNLTGLGTAATGTLSGENESTAGEVLIWGSRTLDNYSTILGLSSGGVRPFATKDAVRANLGLYTTNSPTFAGVSTTGTVTAGTVTGAVQASTLTLAGTVVGNAIYSNASAFALASHDQPLSTITNAGTAAALNVGGEAGEIPRWFEAPTNAGGLVFYSDDIPGGLMVGDQTVGSFATPASVWPLSSITNAGTAAGLDYGDDSYEVPVWLRYNPEYATGTTAVFVVQAGGDSQQALERRDFAGMVAGGWLGTAATNDTSDFAAASHDQPLSSITNAGTAAALDTGGGSGEIPVWMAIATNWDSGWVYKINSGDDAAVRTMSMADAVGQGYAGSAATNATTDFVATTNGVSVGIMTGQDIYCTGSVTGYYVRAVSALTAPFVGGVIVPAAGDTMVYIKDNCSPGPTVATFDLLGNTNHTHLVVESNLTVVGAITAGTAVVRGEDTDARYHNWQSLGYPLYTTLTPGLIVEGAAYWAIHSATAIHNKRSVYADHFGAKSNVAYIGIAEHGAGTNYAVKLTVYCAERFFTGATKGVTTVLTTNLVALEGATNNIALRWAVPATASTNGVRDLTLLFANTDLADHATTTNSVYIIDVQSK